MTYQKKTVRGRTGRRATMKKTLGRRKIEIRKIEKITNRQVTISKRRTGLFNYVNKLSALTGAQIGVLVTSPGNRIFASPNIDAVIDRFLNKPTDPPSPLPERFWWEEPVEHLGLEQLEEYVAALEQLKENLSRKISSMVEEEEEEVVEISPELKEALLMVDGWLNSTGQDGNFSNDSDNFVDSSAGLEELDSSSGLLSIVGSSSGFENFQDFSCGLEDLVGSDDISSWIEDLVNESWTMDKLNQHCCC